MLCGSLPPRRGGSSVCGLRNVCVLNKHSGTAETGLSSSLGSGRRADKFLPQNPSCYEILHRTCEFLRVETSDGPLRTQR
jgi:hypothetical protein